MYDHSRKIFDNRQRRQFIHNEIDSTLPKHLPPSDFLAFCAPRPL
jgi:hypothetical protein